MCRHPFSRLFLEMQTQSILLNTLRCAARKGSETMADCARQEKRKHGNPKNDAAAEAKEGAAALGEKERRRGTGVSSERQRHRTAHRIGRGIFISTFPGSGLTLVEFAIPVLADKTPNPSQRETSGAVPGANPNKDCPNQSQRRIPRSRGSELCQLLVRPRSPGFEG